MGHLKEKYTNDYFLGGVDKTTGRDYGVLGHSEFKTKSIHKRLLEEFEFLLSFVESLRDKDVLEIGFGRGDHVPLLLKEGIRSYHGIDFSLNALSIASSHVNDPRIRFELCDAKELNGESIYDVVVMQDVIEHIPAFEMEVVWNKIKKVLRAGGFVVFSTPVFKNLHAPDHSELTFAEMGLHCNKQTIGSIVRTAVKHGFVIGKNNERSFGFFRSIDLKGLPTERRLAFEDNHRAIALACGLIYQDKHLVTDEEMRSMVPGVGRLLIGCVAENSSKYLAQALRLVQSVRWFGGNIAAANIMVCIVDDADPEYVAQFKKWGAFVRVVPRFTYFHPQSNKLRFFEIPEIFAYDTVMLMDCDTIVVQDPSEYLDGRALQARIAGYPTVSSEIFKELFSFFGLSLPLEEYRCAVSEDPTIWYCNSGVLIFPQKILSVLFPAWRRFTIELASRSDLMKDAHNFCEQASLSLAFFEKSVPFTELPPAMNFPLHPDEVRVPDQLKECDPVIIHYHQMVDPLGFIIGNSCTYARTRINEFNERLKQERMQRLKNIESEVRCTEFHDLSAASGVHDNLQSLQEQIAGRDEVIERLNNELVRLRAIENSLSWRTVKKFLNFFDGTLFPRSTRRGKFFSTLHQKIGKRAKGGLQ